MFFERANMYMHKVLALAQGGTFWDCSFAFAIDIAPALP